MSKVLLAFAILGLGLTGAVFAVQNTKLAASQESIIDVQNNNLVSGSPFVEKLDASKGQLLSGETSATDEFTNSLAKKIAEINPSGPQLNGDKKDITVPNPEQISADLILDAKKNFSLSKFIPVITDSEIKITADNTKNSFFIYMKKFDEMNAVLRDGINAGDPEKDFSQENITQNINHYNDAIKTMYALSVPKILSSFHKTEISYLRAELALLEKIKNAETDPMGALLAGENFQKLDDEFNVKMNEQLQLFLKATNKK